MWINPAHHWRNVGSRVLEERETVRYDRAVSNFFVYQPEPWLPRLFGDTGLSRALLRARVRRAKSLLREVGCTRFVLYVWRPEFAAAADASQIDLICYHIADEYSFADDDAPNSAVEEALIAKADNVFMVSGALIEKKGHLNPSTYLVPNGVDFASYSTLVPEPRDLAAIPRPRIGYVGYLKKQLDWTLIESLADRHHEWSFVFAGATSPHSAIDDVLARLSRRANVHFLGAKPTRELCAFPQHFDVCIMPYRRTAYASYINPLKLNEYLRLGPSRRQQPHCGGRRHAERRRDSRVGGRMERGDSRRPRRADANARIHRGTSGRRT